MPAEKGPAFIRTFMPLLNVPTHTGYLDGTGAITFLSAAALPGFVATLEKIVYTVTLAHTGSGGTQTFKVRKGGATGTVVATITLALASVGTIGNQVIASVAAADDVNARFIDSDTLSFTRDASGTAYTAGNGFFTLIWRQKPQARI
jgi:hypothetical protein